MKTKLFILFQVLISLLCPAGPSALVSEWLFNEGAGNIAGDSVGNNDCIVYKAQWTNDRFGRPGGALKFDGLKDFACCPAAATLNIINDLSVEFWFKPEETSNSVQQIVRFGNFPCAGAVVLLAGNLSFSSHSPAWDTLVQTKNNPITRAKWHHVIVTRHTRNGGAIGKVYLNGRLEAEGVKNGDTMHGDDEFYITGAPLYFKGSMDELRIYDHVLSLEDVKNLYEKSAVESIKDNRLRCTAAQ